MVRSSQDHVLRDKIKIRVMIRLDDLAPFLFIPGYYFALPFSPFSVFLFEIMCHDAQPIVHI